MSKQTQGIFFFFEWLELLEDLPGEEAMAVIRNIHRYMETGEEPPEMSGGARAIQKIMLAQVKRNMMAAMYGRRGAEIARQKRADASAPSKTACLPSADPPDVDDPAWCAYYLSVGQKQWDEKVRRERAVNAGEAPFA